MSLSAVVGNALSGLQASQAGLRSSSNNVANVNTPGYARTIANLQSRNVAGTAMGVEVAGITRIADKYLQTASLSAISAAGAGQIRADALDRLQAQFGGMDDPGSLFARLNNVFSGFAQASVDPSLSVSRLAVAADLDSFFDESERLSIEIRAQRLETDARINTTLARTNEILHELFELNANVQNLSSAGGDTSGAANRQSELLDELSGLLDVRADYQPDGRVVVRTGDGVLLVDNFAVTLNYAPAGTGAYEIAYGRITANTPNGGGQELDSHVVSGELASLMELRDQTLPDIARELGELTAGAADALNAAHNNSAAYPARQTLTGRNTGLLGADLHNFTGATTLAVTDTSGMLVSRIDIDFDAGTLSVDGGAAAAIGNTVDTLTTAINTALGANGSASFANGVMQVSATSATNGIAMVQDALNPSDRGGRGFSHFFGLNDLVSSTRPGFFQTGLTGAEAHGYTVGSGMSFRIEAPNGGSAGTVDITLTAAMNTFDDVITALNDPTTGLGRFATFSLDANGGLVQTPVAGFEGFKIEMTADDTARPGNALSFSEMFGVGLSARAGRAEIFNVDPAIRSNGALMALGTLDIDATTAAGDVVLSAGDSSGGLALQAAFSTARAFDAAGTLAASNSGLQDFAARFAGQVGSRSYRAQSEADSALVLRETAQAKRANVEGVNLDEELANMTLFQQSYNASARMLQAAKDMTDALMSIA